MPMRLKIIVGDTCWPVVYCYKLIMADEYPAIRNILYPFLYFSVTWLLPETSTLSVIQYLASSTFT